MLTPLVTLVLLAAASGPTRQQLLSENDALRNEVARLRGRLVAAEDGASPPLRPPADAQQQQQQQQCPKAFRPAWTGLPNGSFAETCRSCRRTADTLTCSCLRADAIDTSRGPLLPLGNVTGSWDMKKDFSSGARVALRMQELTPSLSSFTFLCLDGGYADLCSSVAPGHNGSLWHEGRGVANVQTGEALLLFDNLAKVNATFQLNFTQLNFTSGMLWTRSAGDATTTSMSLDACRGNSAANITNENGHLSCDWKQVPPPRVGNKTGQGLLDPDHTCRYFHHYSFVAPQFKVPADPIRSFVLLDERRSALPPPPHDIAGLWTMLGSDGAIFDDSYLVTWLEQEGDSHTSLSSVRNFTVKCIDGGPQRTCSPFDDKGGEWVRRISLLAVQRLTRRTLSCTVFSAAV